MSITISTPQQICNAPSNTSPSKMLYSFPESKRFQQNKQNIDVPFYNPRRPQSSRTTSFGYGSKYDFTKDMPKTPAPSSYQISSDFQPRLSARKGFGFGNSREKMIVTGPLAQLVNNKNPGPGQYQTLLSPNKNGITIKGQRPQTAVDRCPGPGNYETKSTITGQNFFSKYKDHLAGKFSNSAQRFKTVQNQCPGPGNYNTTSIQINTTGRYTLSKMSNSKVRQFGKAKRKALNQDIDTPGPGNYQLPSQFGYYASKKEVLTRGLQKKK